MHMQIMQNHVWNDETITKVTMGSASHKRWLHLDITDDMPVIILSKDDVVALAKDMGLVVYERDACL